MRLKMMNSNYELVVGLFLVDWKCLGRRLHQLDMNQGKFYGIL